MLARDENFNKIFIRFNSNGISMQKLVKGPYIDCTGFLHICKHFEFLNDLIKCKKGSTKFDKHMNICEYLLDSCFKGKILYKNNYNNTISVIKKNKHPIDKEDKFMYTKIILKTFNNSDKKEIITAYPLRYSECDFTGYKSKFITNEHNILNNNDKREKIVYLSSDDIIISNDLINKIKSNNMRVVLSRDKIIKQDVEKVCERFYKTKDCILNIANDFCSQKVKLKSFDYNLGLYYNNRIKRFDKIERLYRQLIEFSDLKKDNLDINMLIDLFDQACIDKNYSKINSLVDICTDIDKEKLFERECYTDKCLDKLKDDLEGLGATVEERLPDEYSHNIYCVARSGTLHTMKWGKYEKEKSIENDVYKFEDTNLKEFYEEDEELINNGVVLV